MNTPSNETITALLAEARRLEEKSNILNWNAETFWKASEQPGGLLLPNDYEKYQQIVNEADELLQQAMVLHNRIRDLRGLPKLPAEPVDDDAMPCMVNLDCDHCDMCEDGHEEDDEPMYLCGSFINAQTERHARATQRETEEDDMLRNAVRALEQGDTTPIRHFSIGSRQGRRNTLRELRELLDDMIADLDDEHGAQHAEALAYREGGAK